MAKTSRIKAARRPPQPRRKSAAAKPHGEKSTRKPSGAESPYHHGDLHVALLKAAQTVLERDSLPGLTLRAVAREAGVSHAAPTHHFGDLTGLLSELAAVGFRNFNASLTAASATGTASAKLLSSSPQLMSVEEDGCQFAHGLLVGFDQTRPSDHLDRRGFVRINRPGLDE